MKTTDSFFIRVQKKIGVTTLLQGGAILCKASSKDLMVQGDPYDINAQLTVDTDTDIELMSVREMLEKISSDKSIRPLSLYELLTLNWRLRGLKKKCPIVIPGFALLSKYHFLGKNESKEPYFYVCSLDALEDKGFILASDVMFATTICTETDKGFLNELIIERDLATASPYP